MTCRPLHDDLVHSQSTEAIGLGVADKGSVVIDPEHNDKVGPDQVAGDILQVFDRVVAANPSLPQVGLQAA
jgi:hypothetical protein